MSAFRLFLPLLALLALLSKPTLSADYQKGLSAYNKRDFAAALAEWKPLAAQGHAEAQSRLGNMYIKGFGVTRNYDTALIWQRRAAEQGLAMAQFSIGYMYFFGLGVPRNLETAVNWYKRAADQGLPAAQSGLGIAFANGRGVPKDYAKALKYYRLAAEQGFGVAQNGLAGLYYSGHGVNKDYNIAVKWYTRAAEQGLAEAQHSLGTMYLLGKGVKQDYLLARKWYRQAAAQDKNSAKEQLEIIEKLIASNGKKTTPPVQVAKKKTSPFPTTPINVKFPQANTRPDDIAVIIGNADYKKLGHDIPNVTPAYADAAGFRNYVLSRGVREGNIIHIKDATSGQMDGIFGNERSYKGQLFNWTKPNVSKIYVYYAGHGAPAGDEGTAYLVPADASLGSVELTGYSLKLLYKNLAKIPATSITVVLESCFSGISHSGTLIPRSSGITVTPRTPTVSPKITVISAGALNQIASWEQNSRHSLFTKYFLKGMSGEGDKKPYGNSDGSVSLDELDKYLGGTLTYYARRYYGRDQSALIVKGGG